MELKTVQTLKDNLFKVRFETTASTNEAELVNDFGEPTISMGGNFYGNVVAFEATPAANTTLTQGQAVGVYSSGIIRCLDSNLFTIGPAGAYTISSSVDASFTLSTSTKKLFTDSPLSSILSYESQAKIFVSEVESRMITAINVLRNKVDTFSGTVIKTV